MCAQMSATSFPLYFRSNRSVTACAGERAHRYARRPDRRTPGATAAALSRLRRLSDHDEARDAISGGFAGRASHRPRVLTSTPVSESTVRGACKGGIRCKHLTRAAPRARSSDFCLSRPNVDGGGLGRRL